MGRRRRFATDEPVEPDTAETPEPEPVTPEPPPVMKVAGPIIEPADTSDPNRVTVLLALDRDRRHLREHQLPLGDGLAFRVKVNHVFYEHVANDATGRWIYVRS